MRRCKLCVIPDTRPDTAFVDDVCSACISYAKRPTIDWEARKAELIALLDRHDGRCIVPSSGGKDSTFQVLKLLELGADVTVVTATTCHLTPIGRANIDNLARYARTIEVTPNRTVRAKLNRLGLELVGDPSWPEHISIHRVPFRVACDMNIPLIFYGENPLAQYGSPPGLEDAREMTQRWVSEFAGFLGLRTQDVIGQYGITKRHMDDYAAPSDVELKQRGVAAYFLGQFIPWSSHRNAEIALEHGMKQRTPSPANWWHHENLDCSLTGLHDFLGWLKYGYGRACAQTSIDVRAGEMSRNTAATITRNCDGIFPMLYMGVPLDDELRLMAMTREEFLTHCHMFMNKDLFVKSRFEWGETIGLKEERCSQSA